MKEEEPKKDIFGYTRDKAQVNWDELTQTIVPTESPSFEATEEEDSDPAKNAQEAIAFLESVIATIKEQGALKGPAHGQQAHEIKGRCKPDGGDVHWYATGRHKLVLDYWLPYELPPAPKETAKRYYIGDPCYFISNEEWMDFLEAGRLLCNGEYDGKVFEYKGRRCWCHGTAYGDGCYRGTDGNSYPVDAGLIGIVEMLPGEELERSDLGTVREFSEFPNCHYDDGTFHIGDYFEIYTDNDPDWDEDED